MDKFTNDVLSFIRKNRLLKKGDTAAVGFSGGADSTALLMVLWELRALLGITVCAVHVNHGLRGEEARRDEEFCRTFADELGIPFCSVSVDVPGFAAGTGLSEEEAARILRYRALDEYGRRLSSGISIQGSEDADESLDKKSMEPGEASAVSGTGSFRIAVAHHADDQAETILFNMLRGSGLKGLGGMRPLRDNIIRPLLGTERAELLKWLENKGAAFVTDSTNLENDHTRNRLRNVIMPLLKEEVNSRASGHISALGEKIYEADKFIRDEAVCYIRSIQETPDRSADGRLVVRLGKKKLKEKVQIFRIYVIIEALRLLGVPLRDWGDRHFHDIDGLLFMGGGKHIDLPKNAAADNIRHETIISRSVEP